MVFSRGRADRPFNAIPATNSMRMVRVDDKAPIDSKSIEITAQPWVQTNHPFAISASSHGKCAFPMPVEIARKFHEVGVGGVDREGRAALMVRVDHGLVSFGEGMVGTVHRRSIVWLR